jgi:hypothetical protein
MPPNFKNNGPYKIQYYLLNNIILLVTTNKFGPNPMLININKLKPCKFIKYKTLQPILAKHSDLVTNEHVQTKEPKPLLIEPKDLQLIKFELVNHHLTHDIIKRIDVHVHYYHDMPI